jgi:hypothetical protein
MVTDLQARPLKIRPDPRSSGVEPHTPTRGSAAVALHPPPPGKRGTAGVSTRHTIFPPHETDNQADATPTTGKSHSHVPLPTIPLPFVDLPFPPLPEGRLADVLASILGAPQPTTRPTKFRFEWSAEAADHNLAVLQKHALDLDIALAAQPFSSLKPGWEFRPVKLLAPCSRCTHSGRSSRSASPPAQRFRSAI